MATLVLTTVGGLVGGPVGAALGAIVGRQVDAAVLAPRGREGPRLADLKVQASTYGQQIPKIFGTMRVAGNVIWATDLIERRNRSGGGKGRPAVTEYSYAASLAVALSSRPIRAIRRIWADGNLLRGASGVFTERCIFRSYDGSEDQPVDPLIAAAVGATSASAFRGIAYALFEELELASFGNRIPSLTFEVEADAGDVDAGFIGDSLLDGDHCAGRWPFSGYAASGDRIRDAIAPLLEADDLRLIGAPQGWRIGRPSEAMDAPGIAPFRESGRTASPRDCIERRRAPLSALPASIRLRHYEPERDYQLGQQTSAVAGGGSSEQRVDLPAVLAAASARGLAADMAARASDGRERQVWHGDLAALVLPVGDLLRIDDGSLWRVAARRVNGNDIQLELCRHEPAAPSSFVADPGVSVIAPDWPDATGVVRLFDVPSLGSPAATAPRIVAAAAGEHEGWRGADAWFVAAPESSPVALGLLRPAAALGELSAPLAAGSGAMFDLINGLTVTLVDPSMALASVEDAALLSGANRAMVGGELLQFGVAAALAPGVWRLSRLLRERGGSGQSAIAPAGTPFVLLDDPALIALPDAMAQSAEAGGATLQWAPLGGFDIASVAVPAAALALRPLAPVHGSLDGDDAGGRVLRWIRCSRSDGGWRDHVDQPVGESQERWRITPVPAAGIAPWESSTNQLHLDAATIAALPPGCVAEIRQIGDFALSPPLTLPLN